MGRTVRVVADGYSFLEGPRWHAGRLFLSDFYTHRVLALGPDGKVTTICTVAHQPSGLGFAPDGALLIVSMLDRRLLRLDDDRLVTVADLGEHAAGPANDMVVDHRGRAYVGNFGEPLPDGTHAPTTLVRVDPDGDIAVAATDLVFPNGIVITPDGGRLLVSETFAGRISAFDVDTAGELSGRQVWMQFDHESGRLPLPDGLALDAVGALWVADATGSGPLRVDDGVVVDRVDTGDLSVYAVALGGEDRRTLFMCAAPPLGSVDPRTSRLSVLLACQVDVPGAGLP